MKLYSEDKMKLIRQTLETEVLRRSDVKIKRMFGCPSYTVQGTLFAFLVTGGIVLTRLSETDRNELLKRSSATVFKHKNRVVKKWIRITIESKSDLKAVMPFVENSLERAALEKPS